MGEHEIRNNYISSMYCHKIFFSQFSLMQTWRKGSFLLTSVSYTIQMWKSKSNYNLLSHILAMTWMNWNQESQCIVFISHLLGIRLSLPHLTECYCTICWVWFIWIRHRLEMNLCCFLILWAFHAAWVFNRRKEKA